MTDETREEEAVDEAGEAPEEAPPTPEVDGANGEEPASEAESVAEDEDRVAVLERERAEYLELAQRARADFDNYRKRSAREASDAERRGRAHVARAVVPAVDNLERALKAAGVELEPNATPGPTDEASREVSAHEALAAGVALVHREVVGALRSAGVESFDPAGEKFDPARHEALSTRPASNGEDPGVVIETLERGYALGEVLIRPARVIVSQ